MEPALQHESPLSPQRAFVVQFHTDTALEQWHLEGRVEHIVSGQVGHFHSLDELLRFIAQVLAAVRDPPHSTPTAEY